MEEVAAGEVKPAAASSSGAPAALTGGADAEGGAREGGAQHKADATEAEGKVRGEGGRAGLFKAFVF